MDDSQRRGYELNYPLLPLAVDVHNGVFPLTHAFVRIEPKNVILTAIKRAEDENALIFRFYEFEGDDSEVRLTLPEPVVRAAETDLMEKEEKPLSLSNARELRVPIGHREIKSVKVVFPDAAGMTPPRRV